MKNDSHKEREIELKIEYDKFLKTKEGQAWKEHWQKEMCSDNAGDFGDYLYDFHTEMLM